MKLNFSVPVIALLAGAAIGFCLRPSTTAEQAAPDGDAAAKAHSHSPIADAAGDATIGALRNRIKELEQLLADEAGRHAAPTNMEALAGEPRRGGPGMRFNPREMMERLKTEDPERYAQMTNHMERFRRRRSEQAMSRLDYLASIDLSALGEGAQETHVKLQGLIAKREELEEKMHSDSISDDERDAAFREMFSLEREIRHANHEERANLLAETVRELGFTGEEADDVVATLGDIIEATSSNFGHHGPPPPGGPDGARR